MLVECLKHHSLVMGVFAFYTLYRFTIVFSSIFFSNSQPHLTPDALAAKNHCIPKFSGTYLLHLVPHLICSPTHYPPRTSAAAAQSTHCFVRVNPSACQLKAARVLYPLY